MFKESVIIIFWTAIKVTAFWGSPDYHPSKSLPPPLCKVSAIYFYSAK